jgi:hypothetical protein
MTSVFTAFFFISCTKNLELYNNTNSNILGNWNLIYDSTFSGVGFGNHPVNYHGRFGDYFDFVNDSIIYTSENAILDTLKYKLTSANRIVISSFPDTCQIINWTNTSLTIASPIFYTPGGTFGRKVKLSR